MPNFSNSRLIVSSRFCPGSERLRRAQKEKVFEGWWGVGDCLSARGPEGDEDSIPRAPGRLVVVAVWRAACCPYLFCQHLPVFPERGTPRTDFLSRREPCTPGEKR